MQLRATAARISRIVSVTPVGYDLGLHQQHRLEREFFSSSPINPYNIWDDYGRSDDDQRHRLVLQGPAHSSMAPGTTAWQHLSHGFQVSGTFQYYSALPFNITAGTTTIQGTQARPIVNGAFIERNAGKGFDFAGLVCG